MLKNNPERKLIRFIVQKLIDPESSLDKDLLSLSSSQIKRFKDLLIYYEIVPFAYPALKDFNLLLPQDLMKFLKNNYHYALLRCEHLWQEFLRILNIFDEKDILLLPIKGIALLRDLYRDKPLRPMVDIDLLIKEKDLQTAEDILYNLGYRKELCNLKEEYWKKKQIHFTFLKKSQILFCVELHWALDFKRRGRFILPELWERIRKIDVDGRAINLLSCEDTLFSLALHNRRFGKMLCLKYICDMGLLLNKYRNNFDWDYVLRESHRGKMRATIFFVLSQLSFLNISIPKTVWKDLEITLWKKRLIQRFIEKGAFSVAENPNPKDLKNFYLRSHFLLYDSFWEPVKYILNIPLEQFARYYGLKPYSKKTEWFYRFRIFYIFFRKIADYFGRGEPHKEIRRRLIKQEKAGKSFSIIRGWGFSMYPNIIDGDFVILKKKNFNVGDVVYFKDKLGRNVMHRVVKLKKDKIVTKGDNSLSMDNPIEKKDVLGMALAIKRQNRVFSVKGKWLYGFFYPLSELIVLGRRIIKKVILYLQDFRFYSKIVNYIFRNKNIEVENPIEADDFYFIRARLNPSRSKTPKAIAAPLVQTNGVNSKYIGYIKISKKDNSILYLYVKLFYRHLGVEEKLLEIWKKKGTVAKCTSL